MLGLLLALGTGYAVLRKKPETSESAAGIGPQDQADMAAIKRRRLLLSNPPGPGAATSLGRPPLTVDDGQYGYVNPDPGRPDGLGHTPSLGDDNLVSNGGGCGCGCTGAVGCGQKTYLRFGTASTGPDIFLRGPAIGVSDDNLAIVRRRG
jgi:hypothetical protein